MENQGVAPGLDEFGPEIKPLARARKRLARAEKPKAKKKAGRRSNTKKAIALARTAPAREALAAKRAAAPKSVTLELTMPHWINGISYGPGRVTVTSDVAAVFIDTEQRVRQNDADMMGTGRAAFIGPGGRKIPVPYDSMNSPALSMIEAFSF